MKTGGKILIGAVILAAIVGVILILKKKKPETDKINVGELPPEQDTTIKDVYGTGSLAIKNVLTTAAGQAVSLSGGKRSDKKSVKDYIQSTVASRWRQTWKDWKEQCKDYTKDVKGKSKSKWRKYMEEWIKLKHPEVDETTWKDMPSDPEDNYSFAGEERNGVFTVNLWNIPVADTWKR